MGGLGGGGCEVVRSSTDPMIEGLVRAYPINIPSLSLSLAIPIYADDDTLPGVAHSDSDAITTTMKKVWSKLGRSD